MLTILGKKHIGIDFYSLVDKINDMKRLEKALLQRQMRKPISG
jgi:hypothetical protein